MSVSEFGVCTYIVRTETFDEAMRAALRKGLKTSDWEWFPGEPGVEQWYIYEEKVKNQSMANYLRGAGKLTENGLG
jgi:hypothetical protein